ncbi:MAG: YebC/PmpR family DNA-binding transcriptional regulator [Candidatus Moraniibacteriota bacterium]
MSGHSHWAGIKHHKGINDAKRAAMFTKYGRNIIVAASRGGGNPDTNFALRLAIDQARTVNMPKDNIERAIRRGTGELKEGAHIEECMYEAYLPVRQAGGPGNVALLIETATDNKNRTVSEIKSILTKGGGKFVPTGSVHFMFRRVGLVTFDLAQYPKEGLENETIESGADDFFIHGDAFVVVTPIERLQSVKQFFESKSLTPDDAKLGYLPTQTVSLMPQESGALEKLLETLDGHPDVQRVWDNRQ